jgi:hypothetical protein
MPNILQMPATASIREAHTDLDQRQNLADITRRTPRDRRFEAAFLHSKSHILRTHPALSPDQRRDLGVPFARRLGAVPADVIHQPAPGGVGYGTFYGPTFKTAFDTGTDILWNVVCPDVAGGT